MIYIIIAALLFSWLCMIATVRWGIGGAVASYIALPVVIVGNALVNTALSENGLSGVDEALAIIWLGLSFYFSNLWYWPLPAIGAGIAIYSFRRHQPTARTVN